MAWPSDDDGMQPPSPSPLDPPWLQRFVQAFSRPVDRWTDATPQLMAGPSSSDVTPPGNALSSTSPVATSPMNSAQKRYPDEGQVAGQYFLPGVGLSYLDPQFAGKVAGFMLNAQKRGVPLSFRSGYRTQTGQDALQNDPTATTPAKNSLHSAGWAVDIHIPRLPNRQIDQAALSGLVSDAAGAGLKWGGNFKKTDPGHFYYDPGGDRMQSINRFSNGVDALEREIPDR